MWYIYTMVYFSAIKKNETMPFAVIWMELKMIILSEVNQKEEGQGLPWWLNGKEFVCQCWRHGFDP